MRCAMEHIVVQVEDKAKAQMLREFLAALDFVHSIDTLQPEDALADAAELEGADDFFALAGLWAGRDIQLDDLRRQAWPRRS